MIYMSPEPDEPIVLVKRSGLDERVWCCIPMGLDTDQSDWDMPGTMSAVKDYAAGKYGRGEPVTWYRRDVDTWWMRPT